jgi:hypothetical protein
MGRLLAVHPCPVCNYHVEGDLHEGGSGMDAMFLRNRYVLAICQDCHHLVSVLLANTDQETRDALKTARHDLVQMEADAVIGDVEARRLLPFFRSALDQFDGEVPAAVGACTACGSPHFEVITGIEEADFDAQGAWVKCPRCEEGRLLLETTGTWE